RQVVRGHALRVSAERRQPPHVRAVPGCTMIKRIAGAVALVALSLLAAAGLHRCEREPARPVVRGARVQFGVLPDGGREAPQWLDVTTPQGADLMPALVREVDAVCGPYPMGSGPSLTLHHALPIPHPTDGTRWALPVDTCARQAIVAYVAAHCAGKSNAACA